MHYYGRDSLWKKSGFVHFRQHNWLWQEVITNSDFIHVTDLPGHRERLSRASGKRLDGKLFNKKIHRALLCTCNLLVRTKHSWKRHLLLWDLWQKRTFCWRSKWKDTLKKTHSWFYYGFSASHTLVLYYHFNLHLLPVSWRCVLGALSLGSTLPQHPRPSVLRGLWQLKAHASPRHVTRVPEFPTFHRLSIRNT